MEKVVRKQDQNLGRVLSVAKGLIIIGVQCSFLVTPPFK